MCFINFIKNDLKKAYRLFTLLAVHRLENLMFVGFCGVFIGFGLFLIGFVVFDIKKLYLVEIVWIHRGVHRSVLVVFPCSLFFQPWRHKRVRLRIQVKLVQINAIHRIRELVASGSLYFLLLDLKMMVLILNLSLKRVVVLEVTLEIVMDLSRCFLKSCIVEISLLQSSRVLEVTRERAWLSVHVW